MKVKKKLHRLLSILLCCVLVLGLMPITAFAADPSTAPTYSGGSGPVSALLQRRYPCVTGIS